MGLYRVVPCPVALIECEARSIMGDVRKYLALFKRCILLSTV